jgi:Kef-type K+ transport system membrane component KefB
VASATVEGLLLVLFAIFVVAKGVGAIFERLGMPGVVGEILGGVLLGIPLVRGPLGVDAGMEVVHFLAEAGVVFLLFAVGMETPLHELSRVGRTSAAVAVAGVVVPLAVGFSLGILLGEGTGESLFLGVALVATSVGITARVLADRGLLDTEVARVILGAAVIDDILGLLVLAIAKGMAVQGTLVLAEIGLIILLAAVFVGAALLLGPQVVRQAVRRARTSKAEEAPSERERDRITVLAIGVSLGFSALAAVMGLAALVGAFFAGMAFAEFREKYHLEHAIRPLVLLLTPVFFAFIGLQLDLQAAADAALLALLVTALAVLTKLVPCSIAARRLGTWQAMSVGAGMVPRGEVGIVVALVGLSAGVVGQDLYAVVVTMALLTTLIGPPLLGLTLRYIPKPRAPTSLPE